MRKAHRALSAAQVLLHEGDSEGVCNRAYYAMFYAAQGAVASVSNSALSDFKTHRGAIAAFGKYVVRSAHMDAEFGRSLNEVRHLREVADYLGDAPPMDEAAKAFAQAKDFVLAVEREIFGKR